MLVEIVESGGIVLISVALLDDSCSLLLYKH